MKTRKTSAAPARRSSTRAAPPARTSRKAAPPARKGHPVAPTKRGAKAPARKKRQARQVELAEPIRDTMNKSELMLHLAETSGTEVHVRDVRKIYDALVDTIAGSIRGAGEFNLHGIAKFITKKIPAQKGGKKFISPFTGEESITKPKPARIRARARILSNVKKRAGIA